MKYLHLGNVDKFTIEYLSFIKKNFILKEHLLVAIRVDIAPRDSIKESIVTLSYWKLILQYFKADKIFVHGMFSLRIIIFLYLIGMVRNKNIYWLLWGGDLYTKNLDPKTCKWRVKEFFRKKIIAKINYVLCLIPGDFDNLKQWYKTDAKYINTMQYPNLLSNPVNSSLNSDHCVTNIQVGNSATLENNHIQLIDILSSLQLNGITIYVPLTYGDLKYRNEIIDYAIRKLPNHFVPLVEFMDRGKYNNFLTTIDVGIFGHERQQGLGNIITLLSIGRQVFLNKKSPVYDYLLKNGFDILTIEDISISNFSGVRNINNMKLSNSLFNEVNLISQWNCILKN